MQAKLIGLLISALFRVLTPDLVKNLADTMLDWVENKVLGTASTVDDAIVLPICNMIRTAFSIPDNDAPAAIPPTPGTMDGGQDAVS